MAVSNFIHSQLFQERLQSVVASSANIGADVGVRALSENVLSLADSPMTGIL